MTIGGNIKKLRTEQSLTQDQLGERLFVTRQTISNWERGTSQPDLEQLEKIAEALGVDVMTLIYGPKPKFRVSRRRVLLGVGMLLLAVALGLVAVVWLEDFLRHLARYGDFWMWYFYWGFYQPLAVLLGVAGTMILAGALTPLVPSVRIRRVCLVIGVLFGLCWLVPLVGAVGDIWGGWELAGGVLHRVNFILLTKQLYWVPLALGGIFLALALIRPPKAEPPKESD